MKEKILVNKTLSIAIFFGIFGGILLIIMLTLSIKFISKIPPVFSLSIYPLVMIVALAFNKRKQKNNLTYLKSFMIAFLVYGLMSIMVFTYLRFFKATEFMPLNFALIIFLRMLGIGIFSSMFLAIFFRK